MIIGKYLFSNFIFTGIYAIISYSLSFSKPFEFFSAHMLLCYGIYNSLQVGGMWVLESILGTYTYKKFTILGLRLIAILALMASVFFHPLVYISFMFFGLSAANFYGATRRSLSQDIINSNLNKSQNYFLAFSLSTNFAFMLFPWLGGLLVNISFYFELITILLISFLLLTFISLPKLSESINLKSDNKKELNYQPLEWYDLVRLLCFLLTYGIMMTIIPGKIDSLAVDSMYSGLPYTINGGLIILTQLIGIKSHIFKFSFIKMEIINWLAVTFTILAYFSSNTYFFFTMFILWTLCESYQLPAIEELLFSIRKYYPKTLSRILVIDGIISLIAPLINKRN